MQDFILKFGNNGYVNEKEIIDMGLQEEIFVPQDKIIFYSK